MAQGISMVALGHKVRKGMENNKYLKKLVPFIIDAGIQEKFYGIGWSKAFRDEYASHAHQFEQVEAMLADEQSRKTFRAVVKYRKTFCKKVLKDIPVYPQYFQKNIFGPAENEVLVDGGAFTGDTIESYAANFGGGGTLEKGLCMGA